MKVEEIAQLLTAAGKTVTVAEACTCGLLGYILGSVPGSSRYFPGGVIAYTGGLKQKVLGVSDELYDTKGSVSPEMAVAMAQGAQRSPAATTRCPPPASPVPPAECPACPSARSTSAGRA